MVAGCRALHWSATGSAQPQRLRASPPRQDQNHRASGSELPGFVPNRGDKGSRAIRVSAHLSAHLSAQGNARPWLCTKTLNSCSFVELSVISWIVWLRIQAHDPRNYTNPMLILDAYTTWLRASRRLSVQSPRT